MNSVNLPKSAKWTKIAMNVIGGFFFNFCKLSGTMLLSKAATCSKPCKAHYLRWDLHTLLMTEQSLMWAWVWTLLQSPVLSLVQNYRLEQTGTTHIRNSNKSWKKRSFENTITLIWGTICPTPCLSSLVRCRTYGESALKRNLWELTPSRKTPWHLCHQI